MQLMFFAACLLSSFLEGTFLLWPLCFRLTVRSLFPVLFRNSVFVKWRTSFFARDFYHFLAQYFLFEKPDASQYERVCTGAFIFPLFFSKFFFQVLKFLAYCLSLGPFSRQRVLFLQQNLRLQCDRCNFMNVMFQDRYHSSCFIFWRLLSRNFQSFSSYYHFLRCFSFPL